MSFLSGWKMKKTPGATSSNISALNPSKLQAQVTPEQNIVASVKPADNQMTKFNGLKRRLAKDRNLFKESKD